MSQQFFYRVNAAFDQDAARYIAAVQQADGAGLEGGVKRAINAFVIGCKKDGNWNAIKAACIMSGARTLTGALVPLKGTAPTNNNFVSGDYDRLGGLIGNGVTKYLATNYAYPSGLQNNCHAAVWEGGTSTGTGAYLGAIADDNSGTFINQLKASRHYNSSTSTFSPTTFGTTGFQGVARAASGSYLYRSAAGGTQTASIASAVITYPSFHIYRRNKTTADSPSNARLAFYSIGENLDLVKLESRLTTLMAAYRAAITDADALTYIAAVEAADGQALEAGVKTAINSFIVGCKEDGNWDSIKASCILAGARTLTGALVPLKGTAPTNNNFVSGDYDRETGLVGNGSTKYLNSNRNNNTDPQDFKHEAVYATTRNTEDAGRLYIGAVTVGAGGDTQVFSSNTTPLKLSSRVNNTATTTSAGNLHAANGFFGASRNNSTTYILRGSGTNETLTVTSATPENLNYFVFCRNLGGVADSYADGRVAFYSLGENLDLAKLDTRVATLITDYGAAI